jgi:urate oxidase
MTLGWNRYGKSRVRLVRVDRSREPHDFVDLTIDIQLEGEFETVYIEGDNASCLPTDTMKNTVYALSRRAPIVYVEAFASELAAHFARVPSVSRVRISATEQPWSHIAVGGRPHPHAFVQSGAEQWTTVAVREGGETQVSSGLTNLVVLKTTDSSFAGFRRDRFTTLAETDDRILATSITAVWRYRTGFAQFAARTSIRDALLDAFATHQSRSVQHTLHAMGTAALNACADATEITLTMPNRHHLLVDLTPFGMDNPNEVFVATDQPYGLIEATVRR